MHVVFRSLSLAAVLVLTAATTRGDDKHIRELSVYCTDIDGLRTGVDASQDGATLAYVEAPDGTRTMIRTPHSRQKVSLWHATLDAAGFDAMELPSVAGLHCGIERLRHGKTHAVTDAVHAAGGRIYSQLWHAGRVAHPDMRNGELPVAPSPIAAEGQFYLPTGPVALPVPRELRTDQIPAIIEDFGKASEYAKQAGFDGVELHGGFGYLADQFLQDGSNTRTDAYGGFCLSEAGFGAGVAECVGRNGSAMTPAHETADLLDTLIFTVKLIAASDA